MQSEPRLGSVGSDGRTLEDADADLQRAQHTARVRALDREDGVIVIPTDGEGENEGLLHHSNVGVAHILHGVLRLGAARIGIHPPADQETEAKDDDHSDQLRAERLFHGESFPIGYPVKSFYHTILTMYIYNYIKV